MKRFFGIAIFFLLFLFVSGKAVAQSSYVLPYPSSMPGNISYKIHQIYEAISRYWYFGDFGQFDYNLKMADKYLVETKTLLEYKQYLLGYKALEKSDLYYAGVFPNLIKAEKNGKNISQKEIIFNEASKKHIEVLLKMKNTTPGIFIWQPEKSSSTTLNFKNAIDKSVRLREKYL